MCASGNLKMKKRICMPQDASKGILYSMKHRNKTDINFVLTAERR